MGEVLSQSEIDALLAAVSSGELSPDEMPKEEENKKLKYMILEVLKNSLRIM